MDSVLHQKVEGIRRALRTGDRPLGYHALKIERVLPQLARARQKVREGSYGFCDDCDMKIPEERLKAAPGATRCVACQTTFECSLT